MGNKKIENFTDLDTYKEAHKLVIEIYKVTKDFPKEERFGITNQLRRAAVSIVSNIAIAEGFGRNSARDKARFYSVAKGSAFEVQAQCLLAKDLKFIKEKDFQNIEKEIIKVLRMLSGLVKSSMDR